MNIGVAIDNDLVKDKRVLREIEILKKGGHSIKVICLAFSGSKIPVYPGVEITHIRIRKRLKDVLFFLMNTLPFYELLWENRIRKFIIESGIEVLHVHDLYMSRCSAKAIARSGKPVRMVLDLHENFAFQVTTYNWTKGLVRNFLSRPRLWEKKEKAYLEYADRIIVLSQEFGNELAEKYPSLNKNIFFDLPNVPDISSYTINKPEKNLPFPKNNPVLFYFGIVAERRGIFSALKVFRKLVADGFNLEFLIIGPVDRTDQVRFTSIISASDIADKVKYIPWIDLGQLPEYLEYADICIAPFIKNPQHESGVANKIYDYMLGKKPLIVSDCKPQKTLVEKFNCGLSYSSEDEMGQTIVKLISDRELRIKMGENGYKAIIEHFNTEIISNKFLKFYDSLKNPNSSGNN